jgi:hypothetical protein
MSADDLNHAPATPPWLAAIQAQVPQLGTIDEWCRASGLGRSLSIELINADVLPSVMIGNRRWVNIWGGLALLHDATNARRVIAVPGEARARELARKAELRAKARQAKMRPSRREVGAAQQ